MAASLRLRSEGGPCEGKVIYKGENDAKKTSKWLKRKGLNEHPYFCKYCKAWHLTSDKLKQRRRRDDDRYNW